MDSAQDRACDVQDLELQVLLPRPQAHTAVHCSNLDHEAIGNNIIPGKRQSGSMFRRPWDMLRTAGCVEKGRVRSKRHRSYTSALINLVGICEHMDEQILPAVARWLGCSFHASPLQIGTISFGRALVQALVSPLSGVAGHYYNRIHILFLGCTLWGLCTMLFSTSTSVHQGAVFWALNGVGLSLIIPTSQSLIADYHQEDYRGTAFGTLWMTGAMGAMLGSIYATSIGDRVIAGIAGWRFAFISVGVVSWMIGLVTLLWAADPRYHEAKSTPLAYIEMEKLLPDGSPQNKPRPRPRSVSRSNSPTSDRTAAQAARTARAVDTVQAVQEVQTAQAAPAMQAAQAVQTARAVHTAPAASAVQAPQAVQTEQAIQAGQVVQAPQAVQTQQAVQAVQAGQAGQAGRSYHAASSADDDTGHGLPAPSDTIHTHHDADYPHQTKSLVLPDLLSDVGDDNLASISYDPMDEKTLYINTILPLVSLSTGPQQQYNSMHVSEWQPYVAEQMPPLLLGGWVEASQHRPPCPDEQLHDFETINIHGHVVQYPHGAPTTGTNDHGTLCGHGATSVRPHVQITSLDNQPVSDQQVRKQPVDESSATRMEHVAPTGLTDMQLQSPGGVGEVVGEEEERKEVTWLEDTADSGDDLSHVGSELEAIPLWGGAAQHAPYYDTEEYDHRDDGGWGYDDQHRHYTSTTGQGAHTAPEHDIDKCDYRDNGDDWGYDDQGGDEAYRVGQGTHHAPYRNTLDRVQHLDGYRNHGRQCQNEICPIGHHDGEGVPCMLGISASTTHERQRQPHGMCAREDEGDGAKKLQEDDCCSGVRGMLKMMGQVLMIPTFALIILQGVIGSTTGKAMVFLTLYFQLLGLSDSGAGFLMAINILGSALGGLLGGWLGDLAARRAPNHGRILLAQVSVLTSIPLAFVLFKAIPLNMTPTTIAFYATVLILHGLLTSWPAPGCNNPIFAEIVPQHMRNLVYALDGALEGAVSALGAPLVGLFAEKYFGFVGLASTKDCARKASSSLAGSTARVSAGTAAVHAGSGRVGVWGHAGGAWLSRQGEDAWLRYQKAMALGDAMLFWLVVPDILCAVCYSGLHWSYKKDKQRAAAAYKAGAEMYNV